MSENEPGVFTPVAKVLHHTECCPNRVHPSAPGWDETEANIALISAAPELYSALLSVWEYPCLLQNIAGTFSGQPVINAIAEALAKVGAYKSGKRQNSEAKDSRRGPAVVS